MKPEAFTNPSGRLVQIDHEGKAYWAFVPDPLPPAITLDAALVRALSDADRALGELAGLGRAIPNPHLLIGPFTRREAVLSSRIEGTQADIADLYAYEAGARKDDADAREVLNYVRAMNHGLQRLAELPVGLRLIRELHAHLMEGVRGGAAAPGEFRRVQNYIGRPGCTVETADFVPPPVAQMIPALEDWEAYLHADDGNPPLVRLAFIHYQFETIHPFLDGNGRIGRLLIPLLLVEWNLLPLPLLYLSAFFEKHRGAYYDLLLAVSQRSAWGDWLLFFLRGVEEQARDAIARARRLQDLQREWRERLQARRYTAAALLKLVDELFVAPTVTVPQVQEILGVTHRAANQTVMRLVDEGILVPIPGRARNRQFVAQAIMDILTGNAQR
jgi:Fic family protein